MLSEISQTHTVWFHLVTFAQIAEGCLLGLAEGWWQGSSVTGGEFQFYKIKSSEGFFNKVNILNTTELALKNG